VSLTQSEIPLLTVGQRNFPRGLNASTPLVDQPKGTVPRLSNLLLTKRGGLVLCSGSKIISAYNGAVQSNKGAWTELMLFAPSQVNRYYVGLLKDVNTPLAVPGPASAVDGGAGSLPAESYSYEITALDGAGGETTPGTASPFVAIAANHQILVSWSAVPNATGYNVYRRKLLGSPFMHLVAANVQGTSYTDNQLVEGVQPPATNTTQTCGFYIIPATSYGPANLVHSFPADSFANLDNTPGHSGGGGSTPPPNSGGGGATPSGGILGNCSPLPQFLQFNNNVILALGNGISPYQYPDGGPVAVIGNTFQAAYPDWVASTIYTGGVNGTVQGGDVILPTTNNAGGFIFQALQGGTSGSTNPVFPQQMGQNVADNNVIWHNTGQTGTVPAPRGAAHILVYAGSLWLANTSPSTTSDLLDGPTVLKMSDVDNPNSWNPLNVAFIGKDDGTQITGLAAYTIAESGIAPTGAMVVFKDFETYQVIGVFGATDFSIQKAQTDLGCIAPRSIQFLPGYGIARLSHLGVAVFDGVRDRIISEEVRPYLFGGEPDISPMDWNYAYLSKGTQCAVPPMYMLAIPIISVINIPAQNAPPILTTYPVLVGTLPPGNYWVKYTFIVGAVEVSASSEAGPISLVNPGDEIVVTLPSNVPIPAGATTWRVYWGQGAGQENQYLDVPITAFFGRTTGLTAPGFPGVPGTGTGGLTRILCYDLVLKGWTVIDLPWPIEVLKQFRAVGTIPITVAGGFSDETVRRLQGPDPTWDGQPITYSVQSPEVFGKTPNQTCYFRRLTVKGLCTGDNQTIKLTVTYMGSPSIQQYGKFYQLGSGYFELQLDLGFCGTLARNAHVAFTGTADTTNLPVEIHSFDWEIQPRIAGTPVSI